jgi:hypothetical protein
MKRLVTALVLVVAASVSAFAQGLPVPSGWQNQRGSDMKLYSITPTGDFTGIYFNRAAGFGCQYGPNNPVPYDVRGHASGAAVTFKVVWNNGIVSRWPVAQTPYPAPTKSIVYPVDNRRDLRCVNITSTEPPPLQFAMRGKPIPASCG